MPQFETSDSICKIEPAIRKIQDNQIKILLIEDNPGDGRLIQDIIKESGNTRYELSHADCLSTGMEFLTKSEYDVLLLDPGLPESQGLSTLNKILFYH